MKEIIIPAAKRLETGSLAFTAYEIPVFVRDYYWYLVNELLDRGIKYHKLRVSAPFKPRSTGRFSQQAHFNGHVAQLARHTGYDFDAMKFYVKKKAIKRGWPIDIQPDKEAIPRSEAKVSSEEIHAGIEECHQLAAEADIILIEE